MFLLCLLLSFFGLERALLDALELLVKERSHYSVLDGFRAERTTVDS